MGKAEMFPGADGEEPISFRIPLDETIRNGVDEVIRDLGVHAAISDFGPEVVSAAFTDADFVEVVDPTPRISKGLDDAA